MDVRNGWTIMKGYGSSVRQLDRSAVVDVITKGNGTRSGKVSFSSFADIKGTGAYGSWYGSVIIDVSPRPGENTARDCEYAASLTSVLRNVASVHAPSVTKGQTSTE